MAFFNEYVFRSVIERPLWHWLGLLLVFTSLYLAALVVHRLYLSPIANFPGPKLAALTMWYQYYWDVTRKGQYTWRIQEMHKKYGPIVRINPWELHINDPEFFDVLYTGASKRRHKWDWYVQAFGNPDSSFATADHDHHRMRRGVLNPYFSKRSVSQLEPMVFEYVDVLCARYREFQRSQEPLPLRFSFAALSMDVITTYCFAKSNNCLTAPDFDSQWVLAVDGLAKGSWFMNHFPWVLPIMMGLPDRIILAIDPLMANLINFQKNLRSRISEIMAKREKESNFSHATIFHEILDSDLPPQEKTLRRLAEEGQLLVAAGQVTTADTLEMTSYHLLANPNTLARLKSELETAIPNPSKIPSLQTLEKLPYLSAVVNEGLRVTCPFVSRSPRISPDEAIMFNDISIPPGTPVSMSMYYMLLLNEKHFHDPKKFKPERWMLPVQERHKLEKYLVPFSKGTRSCLGMNLAMAELYIALAVVFRRFDFELYETKPEDVKICHDYQVPAVREGSKRVRVLVKG